MQRPKGDPPQKKKKKKKKKKTYPSSTKTHSLQPNEKKKRKKSSNILRRTFQQYRPEDFFHFTHVSTKKSELETHEDKGYPSLVSKTLEPDDNKSLF